MRIALIAAHYPPADVACGVGDYTHCLRAGLAALGHGTLVATSRRCRSTEADTFAVADRWRCTDVRTILRLISERQPDVVLLQYTPEQYGYGPAFKMLPLLLRLVRAGPIPVTTFHTLVGGRWIARPYAAFLATVSQGVVSTHPEITRLLRRHLPWCAGKVCEIPIGANIPAPTLERGAARRRLRQRLGVPEDLPVLGTFGFPAPGKGLETLIEAIARLGITPAVTLIHIGQIRPEDRPHRAHLESLAQRAGIATHLRWMGELPDREVSDTLAGVDAYVAPYDEGASLRRGTLMAGFRAGVPIVTTTPRYPDPSLRAGETILAVPPRSPDALASCLRLLLQDSTLQDRLRAATARIGPRFEWATIATQHLAFFEQLRENV
jgi:glycosyltransferase involved in cell wall biosynthesis